MFFAATALSLAVVCGLPASAPKPTSHPLVHVVRRILTREAGEQPPWKLPMVLNGLRKKPVTARCTTYSVDDADGGGPRTRWGTRLHQGEIAADPRYWGPGSVIYIGPPVDEVLIVEDTGGAIRGHYRFDVCAGCQDSLVRTWGTFKATCVPLYQVPPRRHWGTKPAGWHPPVWKITPHLLRMAADKIPSSLRGLLTTMVAELQESRSG